jgi:integrase
VSQGILPGFASNVPASSGPASPFDDELRAFEASQVALLGLRPATASTRTRHLQAMVLESGVPTAGEFLETPDFVVAAIRRAEKASNRKVRHLVVQDYVECFADDLAPGTRERLEEALQAAFPSRVDHDPQFVDLDLGGSVKEARTRTPLMWQDGQRLLDAARRDGSNLLAQRRRIALVAMCVRSGLTPEQILSLDWPQVMSLFGGTEAVQRLQLHHHDRCLSVAVHSEARDALGELHRLVGRPNFGPVFASLYRPRGRISRQLMKQIVTRVAEDAGFDHLDLRQLRAPFAVWLKGQGWHELHVRDAMGYTTLRDLRRLVVTTEEALAQIRTREFIGVPAEARVGDDIGAPEVVDLLQRAPRRSASARTRTSHRRRH